LEGSGRERRSGVESVIISKILHNLTVKIHFIQ
jgi:hypothetical protein